MSCNDANTSKNYIKNIINNNWDFWQPKGKGNGGIRVGTKQLNDLIMK